MPRLEPQFRIVTRQDGIEVVQDLGNGWAASYFVGRIAQPSVRSGSADCPDLIGGPAPTGELTSQMLRDLVPGAAIAHAVSSYEEWAGAAGWPGADVPNGSRGFLAENSSPGFWAQSGWR